MAERAARGRRLPRVVLAVLAIVLPLAADAKGGKAEEQHRRRKASELARAAYDDFNAGSFADGIAKLERSYSIDPKAATVFAIAVAYDQWQGHCAEALSTFERYFAVCDQCKSLKVAEKRHARTVERCRAEAAAETEPPGPQVPGGAPPAGQAAGRLVLHGVPPGSKVTVDGAEVAVANDEPLEVDPGQHTVEVRAGPRAAALAAVVREQETVTLDFGALLPPERAVAEPAPPAAEPEAAVAVRPEPVPAASPAPGGGGTALAVATWASFGVGAAGLAGGAAFGLLRDAELEAESEAKRDAPTKASLGTAREHRDAAHRNAILANVGYGVGAAGIAAGLLLLWLDADGDAGEARWGVLPFPGGLGTVCAF